MAGVAALPNLHARAVGEPTKTFTPDLHMCRVYARLKHDALLHAQSEVCAAANAEDAAALKRLLEEGVPVAKMICRNARASRVRM